MKEPSDLPPEVVHFRKHPDMKDAILAATPQNRRYAVAVLLANDALGLPLDATKADRERRKRAQDGSRP